MTPPFTIVVPARRGSRRLPGKPLADLGGAPMIVRVLRRAAESGAARTVAATDDDEIAKAVRAAGFDAVKTGAHDSGGSRVCEAAEILGLADDAVAVNLQGDEPFMEPEHLSALAMLLAESGAACATLARPIRDAEEFRGTATVKVVLDGAGFALYFSRAPIPFPRDGLEVPALALAHLGAYAFRVADLRAFARSPRSGPEEVENLEQLRILHGGGRIAVLRVESQSFGVDTPADLEKARERWAGGNS